MAQGKKEGEMTLDKLAQLVANGFEKVGKQFEQVDMRFDQVDMRFEQVDMRFEQIDRRFGQFDIRLEQNDRRLTQIEYRLKDIQNDQDELARMVADGFTEVNGRIDRLEAKVDQHFTESDDRLLHSERTAAKAINLAIGLQEDVAATNAAVEQDSLRVVDHERRIVVLEAAVA